MLIGKNRFLTLADYYYRLRCKSSLQLTLVGSAHCTGAIFTFVSIRTDIQVWLTFIESNTFSTIRYAWHGESRQWSTSGRCRGCWRHSIARRPLQSRVSVTVYASNPHRFSSSLCLSFSSNGIRQLSTRQFFSSSCWRGSLPGDAWGTRLRCGWWCAKLPSHFDGMVSYCHDTARFVNYQPSPTTFLGKLYLHYQFINNHRRTTYSAALWNACRPLRAETVSCAEYFRHSPDWCVCKNHL